MVAATLCITAGLAVFWKNLDKYEKSQPGYAAEQVFTQYFKEIDFDTLYELEKPALSDFEIYGNYMAYLKKKAGDTPRSFRSAPTGLPDMKKYAVYADDNLFAEFELKHIEGHGKQGWALAGVHTIFTKIEDFYIIAPAGFPVYVNGKPADNRYKAAGVILNPMASPADVYKISGLIAEPAVEVRYGNGDTEPLAYNAANNAYIYARTITADILPGSSLYINSVKADDSFIIREDIRSEETDRLGLNRSRYRITDCFDKPAVHVVDRSGSEGVIREMGDWTYIQEVLFDTELQGRFGAFAINAAKEYARFMTNNSSLAELRKYFETGTRLYDDIRKSEVVWYTDHIGHWFENAAVSEFYRQDGEAFSCRVTFDQYIQRTERDIRVFPLDVTLFIRGGGEKFLVFDMISNS